MSKFIILTLIDGDEVAINSDHIVAIYGLDYGSRVVHLHDEIHTTRIGDVKDAIEDIVKELNNDQSE